MPCVGLFVIGDKQSFDPGDAICFRPVDWVWGSGESNSDIFRLIKFDMNEKEATERYCTSEPGDIKLNPKLRKRGVHLDLNLIPRETKGIVADIPTSDLEAARVIKIALKDPFASGIDPFDVGLKP